MKNYSKYRQEFEADLFPILRKTVGIGLLLIMILVPAFAWLDYYFYPEYFQKFLYYRMGASILACLLFVLNLKSTSYNTSKRLAILGFYLVGFCIILMIKDVNTYRTPYYLGLLMVFIGFVSIVPLEVKTHLFHVVILYLCYVLIIVASEHNQIPRLFWVNNIFLFSSLAVLITASAFNFKKRFEEFIGRKRLLKADECLRRYADRLKKNVIESESKYASVVNNAKEGILILKDGKVSYCNPSGREILKNIGVIFDDEEIGLDKFPEDMAVVINEAYQKAVLQGESITNEEIELADESLSQRWFEYTLVPVDLMDAPACVLFLRDVTARKQMENELVQSQKMEAIGVMAGGVAHDLNNVFQIVSGYVQLSLEAADKGSKIYRYLRQVEKTISRASMVARQLLIFARKDESRKEVLDVNSRIVSLTKLLQRIIPKMIQIDLRLSADAGFIYADPVKFEQILLNLCINARDAMPEGGRLEISTYHISELPEDENGFEGSQLDENPNGYVCIKIADTGCGIPSEVKDRIFDPFFTTKEKGKGTGLGLSIVYGIVKDHNGFITCQSEPGKGTVFSVYLPSCADEEGDSHETITEPIVEKAKNELILLVDDEEQIRDIGKNMLEKAGYKVDTVESAEAALEYLKEHGDKLRLILLDLNMPGMGGLKFLERMKEEFPELDVDVIICTGYFDRDHLDKVQSLGVKHVINKPFKFSEIIPTIRAVIKK
ncbi:MAG: response regulator [Thermodesulfobacteria bacterium]|nr:response regulator [Thermodesulfobacteriota bacterium]